MIYQHIAKPEKVHKPTSENESPDSDTQDSCTSVSPLHPGTLDVHLVVRYVWFVPAKIGNTDIFAYAQVHWYSPVHASSMRNARRFMKSESMSKGQVVSVGKINLTVRLVLLPI